MMTSFVDSAASTIVAVQTTARAITFCKRRKSGMFERLHPDFELWRRRSYVKRSVERIGQVPSCFAGDHLTGGTALPVITRLFLGMVKMKATTDEAVIRASEP